MADEENKEIPAAEEAPPAPAEDSAENAEPAATDEPAAVTEEADAPPAEGEEVEVKEEGEIPQEQEGEKVDTPEEGEEKPAEVAEAAAEQAPEGTEEAAGDAAPQEEQKQEGVEGEVEKPETEVPPEGEEPVTETKPEEETEKTETPLPQNEDFDAGEKDEATLDVTGEVLSREGSPQPPLEGPEEIRPDSPKRESEERGVIFEEEEEEEEIPRYNREELIERYNKALQEREMLNQKNHALQNKLAEYFKRKKTEDNRQEVDRNVTDQEQRYMKYISNLEELRNQETAERESYDEQIEEMKERKAVKQKLVEQEWNEYSNFKRSVALASVNSRSGRPLTQKEFEIYEINEVKKEAEVSQVRLENIKLRNRLRKRELQLKQKEELAEGLHLIDFEQLKIENQTYNEKIEERNEELMKLRKKITSTVQVLTHLKEKLQFVQGENQVSKQELAHIEAEVAGKRDILSRTKQARDALRHDNSKLQQKCGLLGNRLLLRDYEEGTDEIADLSHRLDQLKRTHAELTLSISGVKKKIEQARAQSQN
uniref:coiled-coil domain-containing protein 96-like n=1 Tax=Styela clava TaxID=7725 RepID=UPI001939A0CF|nr:coiled-coil domain-containing protein 96-like [Styela clava]